MLARDPQNRVDGAGFFQRRTVHTSKEGIGGHCRKGASISYNEEVSLSVLECYASRTSETEFCDARGAVQTTGGLLHTFVYFFTNPGVVGR